MSFMSPVSNPTFGRVIQNEFDPSGGAAFLDPQTPPDVMVQIMLGMITRESGLADEYTVVALPGDTFEVLQECGGDCPTNVEEGHPCSVLVRFTSGDMLGKPEVQLFWGQYEITDVILPDTIDLDAEIVRLLNDWDYGDGSDWD